MGRYADLLGFLGLQGKEPDLSEAGLERLYKTGLEFVHCTSAPPYAPTLEATINEHRHFIELLEKHPDVFRVVLKKDNLKASGLKIICGLQHCPVRPESISDISKLSEAGIRIMQITFGGATLYGGGMNDEAGLTEAGYYLLEEMARNKIILDLSHIGSASAVDIVRKAQKDIKVIVSHTGCRALYNHPRNLSDEVLKAVADNGGIIGVYSITFFLHGKDNSIRPMINHIRHLLNVAGEDAVAIGSDGLVSGYKSIRNWKEHFRWMKQKLDPDSNLGVRWPDHPLRLAKPGSFMVIASALRKKGVKERVIEKILGKNAFRFFSEALP